MRFSDFYNAAMASESLDYPHLSGLDIDIRFDCCLDPSPFITGATLEGSMKIVNGIGDGGTDEKTAVPQSNGHRGNVPVQWAGPGITTFTIVQD